MAGTLNKVMLIGHLGDDPKSKYFDGGGSLCRFPLATNEVYSNKNTGEKVTNTEWHNIVVRNTLRTHIFQKDVVKATNGILFISDSGVELFADISLKKKFFSEIVIFNFFWVSHI